MRGSSGRALSGRSAPRSRRAEGGRSDRKVRGEVTEEVLRKPLPLVGTPLATNDIFPGRET